ncbi:MAG: glutathione S-transferase family protein, partial [Gammaproteobacteria bacterium]
MSYYIFSETLVQMTETSIKLIGNPGSPYTRKMIAYLRYKRIPHSVIWGEASDVLKKMNIDPPKPILLPVFLLPRDGKVTAVTDSTPLIEEFENSYPARSVYPEDPSLRFINYVLEDFGDEWFTKYMFHYRWHFTEDADNAGTLLPLGIMNNISDDELAFFKDHFAKRQIDRLWVVGSNNGTAPFIDKSYKSVLKVLENHLKIQPFLLGQTPSSCDFAVYGQLTQLIGFDPTPRKIAHELAPRVIGWISTLEDRSGLETEDNNLRLSDLPQTIHDLFKEMSMSYVPTMIANKKAIEEGSDNWEIDLDEEGKWKQKSFPYQAKCLAWIK